MQVIHIEPELELPFEIKSNPKRTRSKLVDAVVDRGWYVVLGYVAAVLVQAAMMFG